MTSARSGLIALAMIAALIVAPSPVPAQSKDDAVALWNQAWQNESSARTKQDREQAVRMYEQVLSIFENRGDNEKVWAVATNLGRINCVLGNYAKGRSYYQKAVDVAKNIGSFEGQAQGMSGLGGVAFDLGQFGGAGEYYRKALDAYKKAGKLGMGSVDP